jgi:hydrogenase-4 component E
MESIVLFGVLASTYLMVIAKRLPALVRSFRYQAFFLFLATLLLAVHERHPDLYIVAALLLAIKVCAIPHFLYRIANRIRAHEDIGLFINVQLSLVVALAFMCMSWAFAANSIVPGGGTHAVMPALAIFVFLIGVFLMIFRMTALAQVVGLLVTENGLFLLASTVSGGMPFFVEIAIFFDVFVSVIIMGFFVYRINKLFTHIDVNKLSRLKG